MIIKNLRKLPIFCLWLMKWDQIFSDLDPNRNGVNYAWSAQWYFGSCPVTRDDALLKNLRAKATGTVYCVRDRLKQVHLLCVPVAKLWQWPRRIVTTTDARGLQPNHDALVHRFIGELLFLSIWTDSNTHCYMLHTASASKRIRYLSFYNNDTKVLLFETNNVRWRLIRKWTF